MSNDVDAARPRDGSAIALERDEVLLRLLVSEIHDAAHEVWSYLHKDFADADYHDCALCGATMYSSMDYTHEPSCPLERITAAIDAFGTACTNASRDCAIAEPPSGDGVKP